MPRFQLNFQQQADHAEMRKSIVFWIKNLYKFPKINFLHFRLVLTFHLVSKNKLVLTWTLCLAGHCTKTDNHTSNKIVISNKNNVNKQGIVTMQPLPCMS